MEIETFREILEHKREARDTTGFKIFGWGTLIPSIICLAGMVSHVINFDKNREVIEIFGAVYFIAQIALWIIVFEMNVRAVGKGVKSHSDALGALREEVKSLRESLTTRIRSNDEILHQILDPFSATVGGSSELEASLRSIILHYPSSVSEGAQSSLEQQIKDYAFSYLDQANNALKDKSRSIVWDGWAIKEYPEPYYKKKGLTRIRATNLGYIDDSNGFFRVGKKELVQFNLDCIKANHATSDFSISRIFIITNQILHQKDGSENDIQLLFEVMTELATGGIHLKLMIDERVRSWLGHSAQDFTLFEWKAGNEIERTAGILQSLPAGSARMKITHHGGRMQELGEEFDGLWESNLGRIFDPNEIKDVGGFRQLLERLCE